VVALVPPPADVPLEYGFVMGEPRARVIDALVRAAPALAGVSLAPVVDASEVSRFPPQGGRMGPITLLPPVSCDIPPTRAGDPRFPITQWDADKTRTWLVTGSPGCARDVVDELSNAHVRGIVGLTLEAATLELRAPGLRVVSASAGLLPEGVAGRAARSADRDTGDPDGELRRFSSTLGPVSWWTALGRDAATLARLAIRQLPTTTATDAREVADRRARARDLLRGARAPLWSTEATGWADGHGVKRTVCAVDSGGR
jgi:hypothetical protein